MPYKWKALICSTIFIQFFLIIRLIVEAPPYGWPYRKYAFSDNYFWYWDWFTVLSLGTVFCVSVVWILETVEENKALKKRLNDEISQQRQGN